MATAKRDRPKVGRLMVRCECGFEARGSEDDVVAAIGEHALNAHNMKTTREQVLARAQRV